MNRFLVALLAAAMPHASSAQGVAVGASGAVLITTRTFQEEPGGGVVGDVRPARSPVGLALELRFHQRFRNAYPLDPTSQVPVNLGLRLLRR